jgi:hypothetical protein
MWGTYSHVLRLVNGAGNNLFQIPLFQGCKSGVTDFYGWRFWYLFSGGLEMFWRNAHDLPLFFDFCCRELFSVPARQHECRIILHIDGAGMENLTTPGKKWFIYG